MKPVQDKLYHVIMGDSLEDLIYKVNHAMEDGWMPQGSPYKESPRDWYQAIIRPPVLNIPNALVV